MKKGDCFSALFLLMVSLFVCQQSMVIGIGNFRKTGSGLLPFGAGAGIGVLALVLLFQSTVSKKGQNEVDHKRTFQKGRFFTVSLSLFAYAIAVNLFGFVFSTFGFTFFIQYILKFGRIWRMIINAILITAGNYLLFVVLLEMNLPKGSLIW